MDYFCKRRGKALARKRREDYIEITMSCWSGSFTGGGDFHMQREDGMKSKLFVFVGALNHEAPYFQGARGNGLSVYSFDEETLEIEKLDEAPEILNPTFLSVDASGTHVYANSEVFGWKEGLVTAFRFDRGAGKLTYINMQPSLGSITAHNTLTRDGAKLAVANYSMGNGGPDQAAVIYGIRPDGGLTPPIGSVAHEGGGPDENRQERSHAHSVTELDGNIIIVADLGTDSLTSYRLTDKGQLELLAISKTAPGAGPRHVAVHPNGLFLFVMNELNSTVASYAIEQSNGALTAIDVKPAVPSDIAVESHCADIQISPDGRFLYGSNRGHDSIVVFETDAASGALDEVGFFACGGATPRNLALTPSGKHLFCANQNSDVITIFARDAETGVLSDTGTSISTGTPMCIRILD